VPEQTKKSMNSTVNKALSIIDCFTIKNYQLTLEEISEHTGIPKSTVFRMLTSLEGHGYIKSLHSSKKTQYKLGYSFLEKGFMVQSNLSIRDYAQPTMLELRNKLNLNVQLSIQEGLDAVYIEQALSFRPIRLYPAIGRKVPLYAAACPRVLLAFMEEHVQSSLLEQLDFVKYTENTLATLNDIKENIKQIQQNGYSLSNGELVSGTVAIAVPIFYPFSNKVIAAISLIGLEDDFKDNLSSYIVDLKNASRKISEKVSL